MRKVIYDGDMGGDDLWAVVVLANLVKQKKIDLLGITTCFGNVNLDQATQNILDFLSYINAPDVPVYKGSDKPINNLPPLLDSAFGNNGLSLANIPRSNIPPEKKQAVEWIAETLQKNHGNITIICTGPITNLAHVFQNYPNLDQGNVEILWFGGSICPPGGQHMPVIESDEQPRIGNITKYAEFNAINDPAAANIIAGLNNIKVTYMPMDATQHMDIGLHKITGFLDAMNNAGFGELGMALTLMLHDVAGLDETKFKAKGCYVHDAQVIQYFDKPELFLSAVPINNINFVNDEDKAKSFDAIASGFDFSLLGNHGQMTCEQDDSEQSNHFIVPGVTTFTNLNNIIDSDTKTMETMGNARWDNLVQLICQK